MKIIVKIFVCGEDSVPHKYRTLWCNNCDSFWQNIRECNILLVCSELQLTFVLKILEPMAAPQMPQVVDSKLGPPS